MEQMVCVKQENANCKNKNEDVKNNATAPRSSKTGASLMPAVDKSIKAVSKIHSAVPDHCPSHDSGEVVHLPHETNCTLFYKCVEGNKVLHQCPPTLHFNPVLQVCDLPQFANCTSKPDKEMNGQQEIEENSSSESLAQSTTKRPNSPKPGVPDHCPSHDSGEVVHLPHETNCTLFYKCVEGNKVLHQCPPTLHFNPVLQVCDLPQFANCTSKPDKEMNGQQEIEENSSSESLAQSTTKRPNSPKPGVPDHCPSHDSGEVVHLPHETNCTLFYKCVEGNKVLHQCPPTLHFNPVLQVCDLPQFANCTSKPDKEMGGQEEIEENSSSESLAQSTTKRPNSPKPGVPDHCPSHDSGEVVHLPHETNCTLFYKCVEGNKVLHQCPPTLHFNPVLQVCDLPQFANCTSKPDNEIDGQQEIETTTGPVPTTTTRRPSTTKPGIPDHCPSHDSGEVVHLPHETNCSLFYKCDEGRKVLHQCPPGLHFNPKLQVCDLPQNVNCTKKPDNEIDGQQEIETTTGPVPTTTTRRPSTTKPGIPDHCPSHDSGEVVHLPHETNCSLFYKCDEGRKVLHQCPPTLHFNPVLQVCDLPQFANCTSKPDNEIDGQQEIETTTGPVPTTTTRRPSTTKPGIPDHCPSHDSGEVVHLPHETNCTLFYKCVEGNKVLHQCPPTLHFNPVLQVCDLPQFANCTSKPDKEVNVNQDLANDEAQISADSDRAATECPPDDHNKLVHIPHETNCSLFYKCNRGQKILHQCPPTLHFNPRLNICDFPENAKCESKPEYLIYIDQDLANDEAQISADSDRAATECPPDDHNKLVHIPHETNCSLFYKCNRGQKILHQCPPTLHFNPRLNICDLPENAKCESKPEDEVDKGQDLADISIDLVVEPVNRECPLRSFGEVVHLAHEFNCSLFYKCVNGKKVRFQCPLGLHYNPVLQVCDYPEYVNCVNA
ncbi:chitin-binding domain protein cbd-1-like [Polistes fuscatus]|uniref:chitin-binding domain protein cbd-1-like n=1 Tax=Polistes fuscatus TaxID=30207 RepID=UPI001CA9647F|nr:chitin-binding domain protein cbd-1-like [Polistes fuscatus]